MILSKNLDPKNSILSLEEWFLKCPPQGKTKHWKKGRSAVETAKHWLHVIPREFRDILRCINLEYELCFPELVTYFDKYHGNGRNHDLFIIAKDKIDQKTAISIESKVDESFGKTIRACLSEVERKKNLGESTNADARIAELKRAIFPNVKQKVFELLRYQLLTAVAGTLVEAKIQGAQKAVFLVQTFLSPKMNSKLHCQNQRDLDFFMEIISNGELKIIHDGDLYGPFRFAGNEYIPNDVELWIGKYSISI